MFVVRPARPDDLDAIAALAERAEYGLTTLPKDRQLLQRRLENACRNFALAASQPGGEYYLFVGIDEQAPPLQEPDHPPCCGLDDLAHVRNAARR